MIVTICNKTTGHFMLQADDSPGTKAARLIAEGHIRVFTAPPSPDHRWNGKDWEIDPALEAARKVREKAAELAATDVHMARFAEDMWEVLKAKGLVSDDDLPEAARTKYQARRAKR